MPKTKSQTQDEPRLGRTVIEDSRDFVGSFKSGILKKTLGRDLEELKATLLSEERIERLLTMGKIKQGFFLTAWFAKALYLKLALYRRIMLLIGLILIISSPTGQGNDSGKLILGVLLLLFVLLLELKDKLFARSELEAGRSVQRALMPETSPVVPGWSIWLFSRQANEVGGDLIDFLKDDEGRFGVALGDVAGKGLGAALTMAKLQAVLRALVWDFSSLAELANKMNIIFCRDRISTSFASLVYMEPGPHSGDVHFVNAGHLPPVLVRQNSIDETPKGSPALGILQESVFTEHQIQLEDGDFVVIYSDGLTEARNERGDFYGEQRFFDLLPTLKDLSSKMIGEKILADVERFIGDARRYDDISIAVLEKSRI